MRTFCCVLLSCPCNCIETLLDSYLEDFVPVSLVLYVHAYKLYINKHTAYLSSVQSSSSYYNEALFYMIVLRVPSSALCFSVGSVIFKLTENVMWWWHRKAIALLFYITLV